MMAHMENQVATRSGKAAARRIGAIRSWAWFGLRAGCAGFESWGFTKWWVFPLKRAEQQLDVLRKA